jgi:hypothetical protein
LRNGLKPPRVLVEKALFVAAFTKTGGLIDLGGDQVWERFYLLTRLAEMGGVWAVARAADSPDKRVETLVDVLAGCRPFVADEKR